MPRTPPQTDLPIETVLDALRGALEQRTAAVLVAPPGAGKTTRVPLALLGAAWLGGRKIIVLEPRRLAARGAAERMAATLGERLGGVVGMRARLATVVGPNTRIEVITEGVFTRMILEDPALEGIGAVLFDEFHERSLDADLGLALALDAQRGLREDLRIVVMSATLDHRRVVDLLGDVGSGTTGGAPAPLIACEGRMFPVETRYAGRAGDSRLEDHMASTILRVVSQEAGSILSFLPGQGEIRRVAERLAERVKDQAIDVAPLYGGLDRDEQDRAIEPAAAGRRKVVLATSIAETSLTIEGVRIVIDCGVSRVPRYEPGSGLTRLETIRVSRAAADQRRGRAGRLEPGICIRLWEEPETQSLPAFASPEILNADLASLLLDCAAWGVTDPSTLAWLDPPPVAAVSAARAELQALGAIDDDGRLTTLGVGISRLALPPRLAAMLLQAAADGQARLAAEISALLVERGLGGNDTDLATRLSRFRADRSRRSEDMRRLARDWAQTAVAQAGRDAGKSTVRASASPASLLALAYPDRIAKSRGSGGGYLLANGRGAVLDDGDPLSRSPFLVIADLVGAAAAGRIRLAAPLDAAEVDDIAAGRIAETMETAFDRATGSVRTRRVRRLGAIVLAADQRPAEPGEATAAMLCAGLVGQGIASLPWTPALLHLRERVGFLRTHGDPSWPDLSDAGLEQDAATWLLPFLAGKTGRGQLTGDDLGHALDTLVPHPLKRRLEAEAPSHYEAPTGNRHRIDYDGPSAPKLAIRVQEMFGVTTHPAIANGRLALTLELLSPAMRPIQITRDLPGFWSGSWSGVRADMRGRYPKHVWPEDPAHAAPTARAKPRKG